LVKKINYDRKSGLILVVSLTSPSCDVLSVIALVTVIPMDLSKCAGIVFSRGCKCC
jgi:hypothetical protein